LDLDVLTRIAGCYHTAEALAAKCGGARASAFEKARAPMQVTGRLFIVENLPKERRTHPFAPAWFAGMMLAATPEGDACIPSVHVSRLPAAPR